MELFDTHCHLNHPAFDLDKSDVRARAEAAGVSRLLCIGYDLASSSRAVSEAAAPSVYAAVGIHPESADEWDEAAAAELRALWQASRKVVAYGEIGLDYYWETVPQAVQRDVFAAQIAFAQTLAPALPLIIHCRDAQEDALAVLRASGAAAPIVMHCFTGDTQASRVLLDAGCFLGIGGVATFKKSEALREAIAAAPLDRLLLETDCPYLAPQTWRGRRNEPSYLPAVAQGVAAVKSLPIETIAEVTTATARTLFGIAD